MKGTSILIGVLLLMAAPHAAQTKRKAPNQPALQRLAQQWQDAWNQHDVTALAALLAEDVEVITVGGVWLKNRKEFEADHARGHATIFKESVLTMHNPAVKFIKPDVAIVHTAWKMEYGKNADGALRPQQQGVITWVVEKRNGTWSIISAQNTLRRE